jgi:hypothetical protein
MLETGNTEVSDLLCVTPPWILMLTPEESAARDHLRHPSARQQQA